MNVLLTSICVFIAGFSITLTAIYSLKLINHIMDRLIKVSEPLYWAFSVGLILVILYLSEVFLGVR